MLAQIQMYGLSEEPKVFARQVALLKSMGLAVPSSAVNKSKPPVVMATIPNSTALPQQQHQQQPDTTLAALLALAAVNPNMTLASALQSLAALNTPLGSVQARQGQMDPFMLSLHSVSSLPSVGTPFSSMGSSVFNTYGMLAQDVNGSGKIRDVCCASVCPF